MRLKESLRSVLFGFNLILISCEEFVHIPPPETELVQQHVFEDDATALSAISGIYNKMVQSLSFASGGIYSLTLFEALYADELAYFTSSNSTSPVTPFYFNNVPASNTIISSTWSGCYNIIYSANRIIEGLNASNKITHSVKSQLLGEALFVRGFCHFYLVNMFGDVPLVTTSDYRANAKVSRNSTAEVYASIISDLIQSKSLLTDNYPSTGRVRPNKGAATALLARAYLYAGEFTKAEAQATEVISNSTQYKLSADLNTVFLKTSEEAIWQLLPDGGLYTNEGALFILVAPPVTRSLNEGLVAAFETNDLRKANWVKSITSSSGLTTWYYAFKYKENHLNGTGAENNMVLRLAEQYLIRAEARAKQDKLTGPNSAESDINLIRSRAGLENTTATAKEQLLSAIEQERRVELFTEWGHRFFDLKRTNRVNEVLGYIKSGWDANDILLPIPQSEILINTNLSQNPGY